MQVALAEGQQTDPVIGQHEAGGVINRLGNPQPFFPQNPALGERAQLGMAPGEEGTGVHGGQEDLTEALAAPRPSKNATVCPSSRSPDDSRPGPGRLGRGASSPAPAGNLPAGRGECESALGGGDSLVIRTHVAEIV